jgi:hypothetical protein
MIILLVLVVVCEEAGKDLWASAATRASSGFCDQRFVTTSFVPACLVQVHAGILSLILRSISSSLVLTEVPNGNQLVHTHVARMPS